MKKYIQELQHNRDFRATELLKTSLDKTGVDVKNLQKRFLADIALLQNRTRGPLFELMAEVIIGKTFNISEFDRQAVFHIPNLGIRRFDLFVPSQGIAFEIKSGYARLRSFVRKQIEKDRYLLAHEERVKRVVWVCFRGATAPLVDYLSGEKSSKRFALKIDYYDIEFDKMDVENETAKQIIRI